MSGCASEMGDVLERAARGFGYGTEKARLESLQGAETRTKLERPSQKVWRSRCESCCKHIQGDKDHYWREWKF